MADKQQSWGVELARTQATMRDIGAAIAQAINAVVPAVVACWQQIKPHIRQFVADGDTLSESDWAHEAESTRRQYVAYKAMLANIDAMRGEE